MVFVHSRKDTVKTAQYLVSRFQEDGLGEKLRMDVSRESLYEREVAKSRNKELKELYIYGFSIHHAGMLRSDR
jgi:replicative superfamily II helicase